MKTIRIANTVSYLTLLIASLILVYFMVVLWYPFNPLEINGDMQTTDMVYTQGDVVYYSVDFCKNTEKRAEIDKRLIDGVITSYNQVHVNNEIGCHTKILTAHIPEYVGDGEYYIEHIATYNYMGIREISVRYRTNTFLIEDVE